MSPLPKQPEYGDSAKLEQLATGTKQTNGTSGPTIQRTPVGRPEGTTGIPAPRDSQQKFEVSEEQKGVFSELAQAEAVRQQWQALAAQSPTPWVQAMREVAERNYQAIAAKVYNVTPNAEF